MLLDHQTYESIFILVSNEMVNTGNHTVTMLFFSVFCCPVITGDKKTGYSETKRLMVIKFHLEHHWGGRKVA